MSDVSTYTVGPGAGVVLDLVIDHPGKYSFVDHDTAHLMIGAHGVFEVLKPGATALEAPPSVVTPRAAPKSAASAAAASAAAPALAAAAGPYKFDPKRGRALYTSNCAACHQAKGTGLPGAFPPLKGNAAVLDPNPAKHLDVILHGLQGENVGGTVYPGAMPAFGGSLSDRDIANIVNHERSSWGNKAKPITPSQVRKARSKK